MIHVPLSSISLTDRERRYVLKALDEGFISSTGPQVRDFERELAKAIGTQHAVATASGTSALEVLLRAMKIGPGDEIIVPAFTFAAPALAVVLVGAIPVFADITLDTWTIDPEEVRRLRTPRTRAVIAVDVLGHPCDYDALAELDLLIIEDAAEAYGATYKGRRAGSCGIAAIFSFHANKVISSGEGGCIVTDDPALAAQARQLNAFGMDTERRYWHTEIGCNHRMSNLVAAVGLAQVERSDELIAGRQRVAAHYDRALRGLPLQRRPVAPWAGEAVWLYTVATERRDMVLATCRRRGVDARAVWPALIENPAFRGYAGQACPRAQIVANSALWLPTWADMPAEAIDAVATAVTEAFVMEAG